MEMENKVSFDMTSDIESLIRGMDSKLDMVLQSLNGQLSNSSVRFSKNLPQRVRGGLSTSSGNRVSESTFLEAANRPSESTSMQGAGTSRTIMTTGRSSKGSQGPKSLGCAEAEHGQTEATEAPAKRKGIKFETNKSITSWWKRAGNVDSDDAAVNSTTSSKSVKSGHSSKTVHISEFAFETLCAESLVKDRSFIDRLHLGLEEPESSHRSRTLYYVMPLLILLSIVVVFMQSIQGMDADRTTLRYIDACLNAVFVVEVLVRVFAYPNKSYFFTNFSSSQLFLLFDAAAAVPLGLPVMLGVEESNDIFSHRPVIFGWSRFLLLCVVPQLRLLKMLRYMEGGFHLLTRAVRLVSEALPPMLFVLLMMVFFFASLIVCFEPSDNIESLSHAMWLATMTMSTVGYGDVSPVTTGGYLTCCALAVTGVLYMAMPLGIIGNIFTSVWKDRDRILLMKKVRTRLIQGGYTAHDIPELFSHFDEEGLGELDISAFREMLQTMNIGLADERVDALFGRIDLNISGSIDAPEFIRFLFPRAFHDLCGDGLTDFAHAATGRTTPRRFPSDCTLAATKGERDRFAASQGTSAESLVAARNPTESADSSILHSYDTQSDTFRVPTKEGVSDLKAASKETQRTAELASARDARIAAASEEPDPTESRVATNNNNNAGKLDL